MVYIEQLNVNELQHTSNAIQTSQEQVHHIHFEEGQGLFEVLCFKAEAEEGGVQISQLRR